MWISFRQIVDFHEIVAGSETLSTLYSWLRTVPFQSLNTFYIYTERERSPVYPNIFVIGHNPVVHGVPGILKSPVSNGLVFIHAVIRQLDGSRLSKQHMNGIGPCRIYLHVLWLGNRRTSARSQSRGCILSIPPCPPSTWDRWWLQAVGFAFCWFPRRLLFFSSAIFLFLAGSFSSYSLTVPVSLLITICLE